MCRCENSVTAKEVCDSSCRGALPLITFTALGDIEITDAATEETRTWPASSLGGLAGGARCHLADATRCTILTLGMDGATGDFVADFQPPSALGLGRLQLHSSRHMQGRPLSPADNRSLQSGGPGATGYVIRNPVVCGAAGSAIMFDGLSPEHYPVYQKNSLLNTNDEFDFGSFVQL